MEEKANDPKFLFEAWQEAERKALELLTDARAQQLKFYSQMVAGQMTEAQCRVVLLDRRKSEIKAYYEEAEAAMKAAREEFEVAALREIIAGDESEAEEKLFGEQNPVDAEGPFWQDEEGIVYGVKAAKGKYVMFARHEVVRTKREDEKSGDLSLTEARERGFEPANAKAKKN